jgi:hypothetical protein
LWATAQVGSAPLPDARLGQRAVLFLAQKAERPGDGILQSSHTPAAAKGCYRFLESGRVKAKHLWQPLQEETAKGLRGLTRVVVVQDTTALMFPGLHATEGLGTADQPREEALWMHSGLALRPDGHPLGLVYNHVWARPVEEFRQGYERKRRPFEEKESYEWVLGIRRATELRDRTSPRTKLLHVFDRAGDVHEVLREVLDQGQDAVIRCCQDRRVEGPHGTIRATVAAQPVRGRYLVDVPRRPGQRSRRATVEVRSATVTLDPPRIYPGRAPLTLRVVWAREADPPAGAEALDWLLLTTLPVATERQCRRVIETYKLRWRIEEFHLALKSGCAVERTQLKTAARIEVLLVLCAAVAVRLLQLTYLARTEPDAPCTVVLARDEWRVLWAYTHRRPISQAHAPPTLHEAVRMIGRLGGHLGRKGDGMPGVRSLWRGWRDLQLLVAGYHVPR